MMSSSRSSAVELYHPVSQRSIATVEYWLILRIHASDKSNSNCDMYSAVLLVRSYVSSLTSIIKCMSVQVVLSGRYAIALSCHHRCIQ